VPKVPPVPPKDQQRNAAARTFMHRLQCMLEQAWFAQGAWILRQDAGTETDWPQLEAPLKRYEKTHDVLMRLLERDQGRKEDA